MNILRFYIYIICIIKFIIDIFEYFKIIIKYNMKLISLTYNVQNVII